MDSYHLNNGIDKEYRKAFSSALKLLTIRDYTEKEIYIKLCRKKYDKNIANDVVKELIKKGYLNDEEYAEKWINNIAFSKSIGINGVKYQLLKKGISYNIITDKLNNYNEYEAVLYAVNKKLRQIKYKKHEKNKIKPIISRFLQRKGFTYDIIVKILEEYSIY